MTEGHRRGVTRGYVGGLVFAVTIVAFALLLAAWGGLALATGGGPVSTPGIGLVISALIVLVCLAALAWGLWSQSLVLLRGRRGPSWAHILLVSIGGYLLWCLAGLLAGLSVEDTWISPYALSLALAWGIGAVLHWAVLARRVYTDRPTPQWPWERRGEPGPEWTNFGDDPWRDPERDPDDSDGFGGPGGHPDDPDVGRPEGPR